MEVGVEDEAFHREEVHLAGVGVHQEAVELEVALQVTGVEAGAYRGVGVQAKEAAVAGI